MKKQYTGVLFTREEIKAIKGAVFDRMDIAGDLNRYYPKWEVSALKSINRKLKDW